MHLFKGDISILLSCCFLCSVNSMAQSVPDHDTTYYVSYEDKLTVRFYFSQKYTALRIKNRNSSNTLNYLPNTTLNMGVGATYKSYSLNLALAFPFLNMGEKEKGKTKYLDLQSHIYTRSLTIDLLGQFYRGFYLDPKGSGTGGAEAYYKRPDLKLMHMGASVYHMFNSREFSFRAAMLQNEWQKQSAGTWLLGGEMYFGNARSDSSMVPALLSEEFQQDGLTKLKYFKVGPGLGYAYTFVIAEHFYAMGAVTASIPFNYTIEERVGQETAKRITISPDFFYRAGVGYNSSKWNLNMLWVNQNLNVLGDLARYKIRTGNVRFMLAYRFDVKFDKKIPL